MCDQTITVISSSLKYKHTSKLRRHLKGIERKLLTTCVRSIKLSNLKEKSVSSVTSKLFQAGTLPNIKSDTVFRKVRSEKFGAYDCDQDDINDMKMKQYVKVVAQPLHVFIYIRQQSDILCSNVKTHGDLSTVF